MRGVLVAAILLFAISCGGDAAPPQPSAETRKPVAPRAPAPSTERAADDDPVRRSIGVVSGAMRTTATMVAPETVVTCHPKVDEARISSLGGSGVIAAQLPGTDLILVKSRGRVVTHPATLAPDTILAPGTEVYGFVAVPTYDEGIVAEFTRGVITGGTTVEGDLLVIATDTPVPRFGCGGPLTDAAGRVVGIAVSHNDGFRYISAAHVRDLLANAQ